MRLTYNLRPDPGISHLHDPLLTGIDAWKTHPEFVRIKNVAQRILVNNDRAGELSAFKAQLKYVLITDHNNPASECGNTYCVAELMAGDTSQIVTLSIQEYFSDDPEQAEIIAKRLSDMQGPDYHNSGNIILILKSQGNTPGYKGFWWSDSAYIPYLLTTVTVHGSINKYESNTVFSVFYPYGQVEPPVLDNLPDFLNRRFPPYVATDQIRFHLTTGHANFFEKIVSESNELFMSADQGGN